MHVKTDSEATSIDAAIISTWATATGPRSPPRAPASSRPVYFVQSPSNHDLEKMSYGSGCFSPMGSPTHNPHYYHCSPVHHSRESSTSRFSDSLKPLNHHHRGGGGTGYKTLRRVNGGGGVGGDEGEDDEMDGGGGKEGAPNLRLYICLFLAFVVLFTAFSLILWGASKSYRPKIIVKGMVFENMNLQAGNDRSGVPTDMLSLNSTVRILYRNPATFFTVHVTSTPFELHYFQIKLASGQMKKFKESRKSQRHILTVVEGHQVPLYGGVPLLSSHMEHHMEKASLPLNLTLVIRSRAYILGRLVTSKFYSRIRCSLTLRGDKLGRHINLNQSCIYH